MAANVRVDVVDVRNGLRLFQACHFAGGSKQYSTNNCDDSGPESREEITFKSSTRQGLKQLQLN